MVLVAVALAACTVGTLPAPPTSSSPSVADGSASDQPMIEVATNDSAAVATVEAGNPPVAAAAALDQLRGGGLAVGEAVHISGDASSGATLTKHYDTPVPAESEAVFAYFDDDLGGWRVVPSVLSDDRLALTAHVNHFSWWSDFVSSATFQIGKLFDTRVVAPTCEGTAPSWVDASSIVFLDDENAPLRWCVGSDPAHSDILVVKVAVNRGYGTVITPAVLPTWAWSSFLDQNPFEVVRDLFADADSTISGTVDAVVRSGALTPGGSELDFGFSEEAVRAAGSLYLPLVTAEPPDLLQVVVSVLMKQLVDQSGSQSVSYAAGLLAATHCTDQLTKTTSDWSEGAGALLDCVSGAAEAISQGLARYMAGSSKFAGMSESSIGAEAAKFFRFIKITAAIGVGFQLGSYTGDLTLDDAARTLSLGLTVTAPAAPDLLRHDGYEGLTLGMTVDQARAADPTLTITDRPSSQICTTASTADADVVVFNPDGTLRYISVRGAVQTPEGLREGDKFERAFQFYTSDFKGVGANNGENRFYVEPGSTTQYVLQAQIPDDWAGGDLPLTTSIRRIVLDGGQRCFG